jgi:hypothetical protein
MLERPSEIVRTRKDAPHGAMSFSIAGSEVGRRLACPEDEALGREALRSLPRTFSLTLDGNVSMSSHLLLSGPKAPSTYASMKEI